VWVASIVQHLQGSLVVSKLKDDLKKAEDSLASMLSANIALARDNSELKAHVAALELKSKGLETRASNVEDSTKLSAEKIKRLKLH